MKAAKKMKRFWILAAFCAGACATAFGQPAASLKPDFAVTALALSPAAPVRGGTFTATVTVRNQGNLSADAGVVRVWASKPGIAKAGDAGDAQQAAGTLAPGESRTFSFALTVPTRPGTHHARAFVDADDGADEANEGNNQVKTSYKPQDAGVQPLPAVVELRNLEQTYDGAEKPVAVTTDPAGLAVEITYDGELQAPAGAGTYQVVATVADEKYVGSASASLAVSPVEAKVILSDLEQTYDGEPKPVSVATDPQGLKVRVTYYTVDPPAVSNGLSIWQASERPPVKPGSYPVSAHVEDPNYYGKAGGTLVIAEKVPATVKLYELEQMYDGRPKEVAVKTDPPELKVAVTYDGGEKPPVDANTYKVLATVVDPKYAGEASAAFVVTKASATVALGDLQQVFDGMPRNVSVATDPVGLAVEITYGGASEAPVDAGSYAVLATAVDPNYEGAAMDTLVVAKAPAVVELADLLQVYDGEPKPVVVSTDPDGMNVDVTYSASVGGNDRMLSRSSSQPPVAAGSYRVEAVAADENHEGSSVGMLEVLPASQTIDFPEVGERLVTDVIDLAATASSVLPVSFAVAGGPARLAGATLTFTGTGVVSIVASQEGDGNWTAAPEEIRTITAKKGPTGLLVSAAGVNVRESGEGRFFVRLNQDPGATVVVDVSRSAGDAGIVIQNGTNRTFKPSNWNVWQPVTLVQVDDGNSAAEEATFRISAPGMADQSVTATTLDDDIGANLALASGGATISGTRGYRLGDAIDGVHAVSTNYAFTVWTNVLPGTITLDLKTVVAVSRIRLLTWDWTYRDHRYAVESSVDGTNWTMQVDASAGAHRGWEDWPVADEPIRYLRFTGLENSVNSSVCLPEWEVYGPPTLPEAIQLSKTSVNVREGGEGRFFVRLASAPAANVVVNVARTGGDESLSIQSGASLTFKPSNWGAWQAVTLTQADDANAAGETATYQVSLPGVQSRTLTATALDDDIGENLALASSGATLTGRKAYFMSYVIDGTNDVISQYGYTIWTNNPPGTMTLDLGAAATVSRVRLLNWDWTYRAHQYLIESSADGETWATLADASAGEHHGWEDWAVADESIRYLRLTGLSNSANTAVCISELEVIGVRTAGRQSQASARASAAVSESEPVLVLTSDGPTDETGWTAVDGDEDTAWVGQRAGGGYVVVEYRPALELSALEVVLAEGSLTNIEYLYSTDAQNWQPLPDDLGSNPISLNYLWLVFPDDGTAAVPQVLEIVPNP